MIFTGIVVVSRGGEVALGRSRGSRATTQSGSEKTGSDHRHSHFGASYSLSLVVLLDYRLVWCNF